MNLAVAPYSYLEDEEFGGGVADDVILENPSKRENFYLSLIN